MSHTHTVSGYGFFWKLLYQWREKRLNDDLIRVRELQQQLGVLRGIKAARDAAKQAEKEAALSSTPPLTPETPDSKADKSNSKPKGETLHSREQ